MRASAAVHLLRVHVRTDVTAVVAAAWLPAVHPRAAAGSDGAAAAAAGHARLCIELARHHNGSLLEERHNTAGGIALSCAVQKGVETALSMSAALAGLEQGPA